MTAPATEADLVVRAKSGDGDAFGNLVAEHRARLWSICFRITGNEHDAEDALQDALTAAWLHLESFRSDSRFGTWLYRIASNAAIAVLRRRRDVPTESFDRLDRAGGPDPIELIADRDRIRKGLAALPAQFREALVLREYGELTYEEIAAHQRIGIQTVKSRLNRARTALAVQLRGEDP